MGQGRPYENGGFQFLSLEMLVLETQPPYCEETLAAHREAPVEPIKRPPTLRSDDLPVNSPANAPAMGVRHLGSRYSSRPSPN